MNEDKTLKWRLSEKPTVENLTKLVYGGIITKDEARKIVLDESTVTQSDIESIKAEIELLRKLVLESNKNQAFIKIIEKEIPIYVERHKPYPWIYPYVINTLQYSKDNSYQLCNSFNSTATALNLKTDAQGNYKLTA